MKSKAAVKRIIETLKELYPDALCSLLHFSQDQRRYFTNVPRGNGLMKSGNAVIPIDGRIPDNSKLYRLYSTTFGEGN